MGAISDDAVRERAYHIWEREGRPYGRDFEHWVRAKVELVAEANSKSKNAVRSAPPSLRARTNVGAKPATSRAGRAGTARPARAKKPA